MEQILEKSGHNKAVYDVAHKMPEVRLNLTAQKKSSGIRDDENLLCATPPDNEHNMIKYEPYHTGMSYIPSNINISINVDHHYNNSSFSPD